MHLAYPGQRPFQHFAPALRETVNHERNAPGSVLKAEHGPEPKDGSGTNGTGLAPPPYLLILPPLHGHPVKRFNIANRGGHHDEEAESGIKAAA
jgi:hypothetical protein